MNYHVTIMLYWGSSSGSLIFSRVYDRAVDPKCTVEYAVIFLFCILLLSGSYNLDGYSHK